MTTMRMLSVSLLLCAAMTAVAATTCPYGWSLWGGNCYRFELRKEAWAIAERRCLAQGGHLASFHSRYEYRFVQNLIHSQTRRYPWTWIGVSDAQMENIWLWSDGSRWDFTYWASGEPNNWKGRGLGGQHCALMNWPYQHRWDDTECIDRHHSVCKKLATL